MVCPSLHALREAARREEEEGKEGASMVEWHRANLADLVALCAVVDLTEEVAALKAAL